MRNNISTHTVWETLAGYSRAVQVDSHIYVSGTTATDEQGACVGTTVSEQTRYILEKIEIALMKLGSTREDVVRTRIYVRDINDWETAARAHGIFFAHVQPANTLIEAKLVGEEYLVEIDAEAIIEG